MMSPEEFAQLRVNALSDRAEKAEEERDAALKELTLRRTVRPGEEHTLVNRLRGNYAIGPHLPNGKPEFGWRQFQAPPIQHEAAARIETLEAEVGTLTEMLRQEAVYRSYDFPGEAAESCGMWCSICSEHVDDDAIGGHDESCVLYKPAALQPQEPKS